MTPTHLPLLQPMALHLSITYHVKLPNRSEKSPSQTKNTQLRPHLTLKCAPTAGSRVFATNQELQETNFAFLCLGLSVQIAILLVYIHSWNLRNYSRCHRSTPISRCKLRHFWLMSVSDSPQFYIPFLKMGVWDEEARNTGTTSVIANGSEKYSCLGRTTMDICKISSTYYHRKKFLLLSDSAGKVWFTGEVISKECSNSWIRKKKIPAKVNFPLLSAEKNGCCISLQYDLRYLLLILKFDYCSLHCHHFTGCIKALVCRTGKC